MSLSGLPAAPVPGGSEEPAVLEVQCVRCGSDEITVKIHKGILCEIVCDGCGALTRPSEEVRSGFLSEDLHPGLHETPPRQGEGGQGWVYFIGTGEAEEPVKIGFSGADPSRRVPALQTGNHRQLRVLAKLPGSLDVEGALHIAFAQHHVHGEWFKRCAEIDRLISKHATRGQ